MTIPVPKSPGTEGMPIPSPQFPGRKRGGEPHRGAGQPEKNRRIINQKRPDHKPETGRHDGQERRLGGTRGAVASAPHGQETQLRGLPTGPVAERLALGRQGQAQGQRRGLGDPDPGGVTPEPGETATTKGRQCRTDSKAAGRQERRSQEW